MHDHVATKKYHKENQYFFDRDAEFSQEKITSELVRYSQFCPNLVSKYDGKGSLTYDGWLIPVSSTASTRAFQIPELQE